MTKRVGLSVSKHLKDSLILSLSQLKLENETIINTIESGTITQIYNNYGVLIGFKNYYGILTVFIIKIM